MVHKRSEYGSEFKTSSLVRNVPVYKEYVSYRHSRREKECAHTPISWDFETVSELSDSEDKQADDVEKLPISELVILEDDRNEEEEEDQVAKEKREAHAKDSNTCNQYNGEKKSKTDVIITKQEDNLLQSAKAKLNKYASKDNTEKSTEALPEIFFLSKTFLKPKSVEGKVFIERQPKRPDRCNKVPRSHPQSAPSARPRSTAQSAVDGKAKPFLNYAAGTVNNDLGDKKTFNVRASSAVYPAALRAKKRNLLQIEKQQEQQKNASAREKRRRALFNERMLRETALWQSEYKRSYPVYENAEYKTSEREPRKQKSYFLA